MSPAKSEGGPALRVCQVRSGIGFDRTQKQTLRALGLRGPGRSRTLPDNPQVRGMIRKVAHLVKVEAADGESA